MTEIIQVNRSHLEKIQKFLTNKIIHLAHESDEEVEVLLNRLFPPPSKSKLRQILIEIHQRWNQGILTSLNDYLNLDENIYCPSEVKTGEMIKPHIFKRAQELWTNKLLNHEYSERLGNLQKDILVCGSYENLLRARAEEKKKEEQAAHARRQEQKLIEEAKRHQEEQRKLQEIATAMEKEKIAKEREKYIIHKLIDLFPEHWSTQLPTIISMLKCDDIDQDILDKAKLIVIQNWFAERNLGKPSHEQAQVIANTQNSLRVIARAGSGKTRTIAQKIIFLIHFLNYKPNQILALAFNRKAKEELERRIRKYEKEANLPYRGNHKVLTFDSLAYNITSPKEEILFDSSQKKLVKQIVLDAIDNDEGLREKVEELMINSFKSDWDKVLKIDSISSSADLERLRSFLTEETLDGKQVKSRPEKRISDFLFEYNIPYRYEMPFTVDDGNIIRPDFYIPSHKIVIEYYGLRGDADYERSLVYKQEYWKQRSDITLIEINPGEICKRGVDYDKSRNTDYEFLIDLLAVKTAHFIDPGPIEAQQLSDEDVIAKLRDRIRLQFSDLVMNAISRAGQMNCSDIQLVKDIDTYPASTEEERSFLDLLPQFISMYKDRLYNNNQIDFNEVKRRAITKINNGTTCLSWDQGSNGIDLKEVKICFVDEFQDFSELFRGLLLSILNISSDCLVNAVGDDWQMINRFAGSKPELFEQFDQDYPKPKTIYLQTNYRSAGGIVDFCNQIMATNGENGKPARACQEKLDQPFKIARLERDLLEQTPREDHFFKGDATLSALFRLYKPITESYTKASAEEEERICFAISRTNNPPIQVDGSGLGLRASNNRELINEYIRKWTPESCSDLFEAITVHSSKGLEADVVIVLQPKQFPTIHQRSIFLQFFGDTPENLLQDELKLFYVACSRAKHKIYFLPERDFMMSLYLEQATASVERITWNEYPCRLSSPKELFKISIQNGDQDSSALYNSTDVLKAHGFDTFSRPNQIATRSQVVRKSRQETLLFLLTVVMACSESDLKFFMTDGLNNEVFVLPGPKSVEQAIAECGESE